MEEITEPPHSELVERATEKFKARQCTLHTWVQDHVKRCDCARDPVSMRCKHHFLKISDVKRAIPPEMLAEMKNSGCGTNEKITASMDKVMKSLHGVSHAIGTGKNSKMPGYAGFAIVQ